MSFSESVCFEIATAKARLDELEAERKKLKRKLKVLNEFLNNVETASKKESDNG